MERIDGIEPLLEIRSLTVHFLTDYGVVRAVEGVDLEINSRQTLALVGESGCGKSVTAYSILRLIPVPPGKIVAGDIRFRGQNLLRLSEMEMSRIRGKEIAMIFQEPMTSLNPVFTIGYQIMEALLKHEGITKDQARQKTIQLLRAVEIQEAEERLDHYPHQFSGGMRQRILIAMTIACNPALLIADEPTTALDVTTQAEILALLKDLISRYGMSMLFITHDLGITTEVAQRVAVMYAGRIFETGSVQQVFKNCRNPYTKGLLGSIPRILEEQERLFSIPGQVPDPINLPQGCKFYPRCSLAIARCREGEPIFEVEPCHWSRCIRWMDV